MTTEPENLSSIPPLNLWRRLWYDFGFWVCFWIFLFMFSLRVRGRRNVPKTGALLLLSNHQSFIDPVLVGLAVPRYLVYLARRTLFKRWYVRMLIRSLRAIPIEHHGLGMDGLRATREALKMGEGVLVFPEGERTHDGKMQQLRAGVSLLLKLEGLTILPVGIAGAFASWPRTRTVPALAPLLLAPWAGTMAVVIGNPIQMSEFEGMSRDEILAGLGRAMALTVADAEELRRK